MKFAEKLKALRTQKGITQKECAEAIGTTERTYISYELDGRYPRKREVYQKLAELFGVETNYLLTEDEEFVSDECIWCKKPAKYMAYWGKAY